MLTQRQNLSCLLARLPRPPRVFLPSQLTTNSLTSRSQDPRTAMPMLHVPLRRRPTPPCNSARRATSWPGDLPALALTPSLSTCICTCTCTCTPSSLSCPTPTIDRQGKARAMILLVSTRLPRAQSSSSHRSRPARLLACGCCSPLVVLTAHNGAAHRIHLHSANGGGP